MRETRAAARQRDKGRGLSFGVATYRNLFLVFIPLSVNNCLVLFPRCLKRADRSFAVCRSHWPLRCQRRFRVCLPSLQICIYLPDHLPVRHCNNGIAGRILQKNLRPGHAFPGQYLPEWLTRIPQSVRSLFHQPGIKNLYRVRRNVRPAGKDIHRQLRLI